MRPARLLGPLVMLIAVSLAGCLSGQQGSAPSLAGLARALPFVREVAPQGPLFSPEVTVDADLGGSEPSLAVDPQGRIFVAAPTGLSPTAPNPVDHKYSGQFWRSADGGATFQHLEGLGAAGLYGPSFGGGDSDIAIDAAGNLYAIDLWLGNVGLLTSQDHGDSWLRGSPVTIATPGDDRQWIEVNQATGDVYITVNSASTGLWVLKSTDQGLTFPQQTLAVPLGDRGGCICPPGALTVDEVTGNVYLPYYVNPEGVGLAVSTDGGSTFQLQTVPGTDSGHLADEQQGELGGSFTVITHDTAGNLYLVWESATGDGHRVMLQTSSDQAKSWSAPRAVAGLAHGQQIFPWVAAGDAGKVAVAWYEITEDAQGPRWDVRLAQNLDALRDGVFRTTRLNAEPILRGDYDRDSLGDFFEIAIGPDGDLHAVWNAKVGDKSTIRYAHQIDGPRLRAPAAAGEKVTLARPSGMSATEPGATGMSPPSLPRAPAVPPRPHAALLRP